MLQVLYTTSVLSSIPQFKLLSMAGRASSCPFFSLCAFVAQQLMLAALVATATLPDLHFQRIGTSYVLHSVSCCKVDPNATKQALLLLVATSR